jgi:phycocyanobilin lyase alpha subunit
MKEPCDALLEALGDIGISNDAVLTTLKSFLHHERPVVRSSACRALLQLTDDPQWGEAMVELLQHDQLQVRRAALMDLGATGWRPALTAISNTLAENSLKLIALRGIAETAVDKAVDEAVLDAMDALL